MPSILRQRTVVILALLLGIEFLSILNMTGLPAVAQPYGTGLTKEGFVVCSDANFAGWGCRTFGFFSSNITVDDHEVYLAIPALTFTFGDFLNANNPICYRIDWVAPIGKVYYSDASYCNYWFFGRTGGEATYGQTYVSIYLNHDGWLYPPLLMPGLWRANFYLEGERFRKYLLASTPFGIGPYRNIIVKTSAPPSIVTLVTVLPNIGGVTSVDLSDSPDGNFWSPVSYSVQGSTPTSISVYSNIATALDAAYGYYYAGPDTRYEAVTSRVQVTTSSYYEFEYAKKFRFTISALPSSAKPTESWIDENSSLDVPVLPQIIPFGAQVRFVLRTCALDAGPCPSSPEKILMSSPHHMNATYQKQYLLNVSSAYGQTYGSGWYNENSTASFGLSSYEPFAVSVVDGVRFQGWQGEYANASILATSSNAEIRMSLPHALTAIWIPDKWPRVILSSTILAIAGVSIFVALRRRMKHMRTSPVAISNSPSS